MKKLLVLSMLALSACKGYDGANGTNGLNGTTVVAQAFCPAVPGVVGYANRESYIIIGTQVYAVYANGSNVFLTLLNPGTYVTTDGRSCHFTVTTDGQVL